MQNINNPELQRRYDYMTLTPIPKLITALAVPTIISMLVTNLYNMADTFFVGRISTQATAAVGIVLSLMNVIQAIGFLCGHGSGNYMSRKLGEGDTREAEEMAATGFVLAFILGLIITFTGLLNLNKLAELLGATKTIINDTKSYMQIILYGAPFMTSQLVINNQLRFQGSAVYAMIGLVSGAVLNIALDPIFIFNLNLGVAGAALATVISQAVGFAILLIGSYNGPNLRIKFKNIKLNAHYLLQIINGGTPSLFRNGLMSFAVILLNHAAGALGGDAAIAAMSVVNRVTFFLNAALIGFGQGYQPVCSYNYGANLHGRVKAGYKFCVKYGTIFLACVAVICSIFSASIIKFFRDDPAVIAIGVIALRWQMLSLPVNAALTISNMMLQSIGKGVRASIIASAKSGLCFIPCIIILPKVFGLLGVETAQPCSDFLSFLLAIPFTYSVWKNMNNNLIFNK
ncbi:MAG: MATE family efflux transporter [Synergistaceae bacterium]|nr:MATE family efflux transporter [Synergistaceae bacterium]